VPGAKSGRRKTICDPPVVAFGPTLSTECEVPFSCTDNVLVGG